MVDVRKMLEKEEGAECEPPGTRTLNLLIKSQIVSPGTGHPQVGDT